MYVLQKNPNVRSYTFKTARERVRGEKKKEKAKNNKIVVQYVYAGQL